MVRPAPVTEAPCGTCRLCCFHQVIVLHPEKGDDPKLYVTIPGRHPTTGQPAYLLPKNPDGSCFYLGEAGCTIYGQHPVMCKAFHCAKAFESFMAMPRAERRRRLKDSRLDQPTIDKGREMHALRPKGDAP